MRIELRRRLCDANAVPRTWVQRLRDQLSEPTDHRTIRVIVGRAGGEGKTSFVKSYILEHPDTTLVFTSTRANDVAMVVARHIAAGKELKVVFFTIPRSTDGRFISYQAIEQVKDGLLVHTKGCDDHCGHVVFDHPHVVVLTNEPLNYAKLTMSRWQITEI